jgi:AraC family transcriptional regulator
VAQVVDLIEARLAEPLRLSELASAVGMSPVHFARVFRRETGLTPARWIMRRRTERAVELIRTTKLSLAEIAYATGFSSQSHMTRAVRALTGATPAKLRA